MAKERLLVVGGDAAGATAAATARRRRDDLDVVVFERGEHTSYAACGIPYLVGGLVASSDALVVRTPEEHRRRGVDARTRHEVLEVDADRARVRVRDLRGATETWEPFDALVLATGSVPVRPDWPGAGAGGVHGVQTLDDGIALLRDVESSGCRRAVIVGGGYVGLEIAEALVRRGVAATVVEAGEQPMPTLDPDMGALVADALRSVGVGLRLGERVEGFEVAAGRVAAVVTDHGTVPAQLVVLGLGVRPAVGLALDAGLAIGDAGGVVVDRRMRTSRAGVWAAGDCVESFHRVSRRGVVVALGTHANKQGRVVGIDVTGGYATFPGVVGTAMTKLCGHEVARTGLDEREAADAGFSWRSAVSDSSTRAGYYPGAETVRVKLVYEEGTGRLLGGQIVGREGAAKRVDVLAAAVWNGMTVEEVAGLDLGYAPPFGPVWDPVLRAALAALG